MSLFPKISIIIPSYNHKKYIEETIKSIHLQTYSNIETIVVDDGSTDGSSEYLKNLQRKFKFQLIAKQNEGLCATINLGLQHSEGEYIVIIASDDFMPAERVSQQYDCIVNSDFDVIAGGMTLVDENSQKLRYACPLKNGSVYFNDMLDKSVIYAPTAMFKKTAFEKFGFYNPEHVIEDYSMWLNILSKGGKIANFDKNWAYYRINSIVTRQKLDWYYKGIHQVFSQYLDKPGVTEAFLARKFKYLIKISIFDGFKGLGEFISKDEPNIGCLRLLCLYTIAILPAFFRQILKKRINRI
jgi:alpha-1,3-rhamnosyltransferase